MSIYIDLLPGANEANRRQVADYLYFAPGSD